MYLFKNLFALIFPFFLFSSCEAQINTVPPPNKESVKEEPILTGAAQVDKYINLLKGKKIAMVVNQTSMIENTHLVDSLLKLKVNIHAIFAPEHGFRGAADAGEKVEDGIDLKTGIPIISLYGNHKKPTEKDLEGIELVVFDIQDVGARFYTYISTLHYVMEACAEHMIPVLVLDRPNPNGHYVDGYVREEKYKSFVGIHPIPIVHGMTIAEYAQMINGENWLENEVKCDLSIVKCENYSHALRYELPIKPSPNLPNAQAINLYPSICFFEGTQISVGRGTPFPFQVMGSPILSAEVSTFSFTPVSTKGAKYPKHENKVCYGFDLRNEKPLDKINLEYLLLAYNLHPDSENFFLENNFFEKLAGTERLRNALLEYKSADEIRADWKEEVAAFKKIRKQYLLYEDFE